MMDSLNQERRVKLLQRRWLVKEDDETKRKSTEKQAVTSMWNVIHRSNRWAFEGQGMTNGKRKGRLMHQYLTTIVKMSHKGDEPPWHPSFSKGIFFLVLVRMVGARG
mmetsp:Transcript_30074/g.68951  ORF Transcript_30074/g.68951 Transcript_30074/m.68951 type:complete len:107 (+) Transcript_30074:1628-1948(+)